MRAALREHGATFHYDGADEDHNRIVTAFSGPKETIERTLFALAEIAFARIDMNRHEGVHPRIGALDVCPFIVLEGEVEGATAFANQIAQGLGQQFGLPVFLYEKSETGKHAADLPSLRKGQFEGLIGRKLDPDHGPSVAHPKLGATVLGVRDWLVAMNVNLNEDRITEARSIAGEMRVQRDLGDSRFIGVRALGLPLRRRKLTQVSMNLTDPDAVSPDDIVEWIDERESVISTELIGVIRGIDLPRSKRLPVMTEQVVF
jgi:glutamate formiminotransferase